MNEEQRAEALKYLGTLIPKVVFDRFIMVLTQIEENNNNALVRALNNLCHDRTNEFTYAMNTGESAELITPIREALDLLEGWIITSCIKDTGEKRVRWEVHSIIGKEVK